MITRRDLEAYRYRETELEQQFSKLKMWQNRLTRLHTAYGSRRTASQQESLNLQRLVTEIESRIEELSDKYREVDNLIEQIPDPKIKAVMTQYYVLCANDWEEVAAVMGISVRTVHRLHGYGLEVIRHIQEKELSGVKP